MLVGYNLDNKQVTQHCSCLMAQAAANYMQQKKFGCYTVLIFIDS